MFIDEKCGNLKLVIDGGELTGNINQKKKLDVLQAVLHETFYKTFTKRFTRRFIGLHSVVNSAVEGISSISK